MNFHQTIPQKRFEVLNEFKSPIFFKNYFENKWDEFGNLREGFKDDN